MSGIGGGGIQGLRGVGDFNLNWLYLVELIVVVILIVFWFFWAPRVLGWLVARVLRLLFWKSHNAYFDIGAVQFSPLGGRIFFSDFRYISRNQSFRCLRGYVIWHFWFRHVRDSDGNKNTRLPFRWTVTLEGAEWFLYNRTPSFDAILEQLGVPKDSSSSSSSTSAVHSTDDSHSSKREKLSPKESASTKSSNKKPTSSSSSSEGTTDWLREFLPIEIKCTTGAILMGNQTTPSIIIAGFDSCRGTYAAVKSRSRFDRYKQAYAFTFKKPKIVFRTNPDYEGSLFELGEIAVDSLKREKALVDEDLRSYPSKHLSFAAFQTLSSRFAHLFRPHSKKKEAEKTDRWAWKGLARYNVDEKVNLPYHEEYAKVTTLLASPEMDLTYYCDVAGPVPPVNEQVRNVASSESWDIGNGDLSPEWGMDLEIKGGTITYGPWADRQRGHFQQAFTPATFFDHDATPRLKPGDERVHTAFKMFVEFSSGVTYRIPTRESSKDWQYRDMDAASGPVARPFGWIDIALGSDSTVTFVMPVVATSEGYDMRIEIHLDHFSAASSVNYVPFVSAKSCRVHCALPSPLRWNVLRTWTFDVNLAKPEIYLLRDHIFLMTDLAKDWTSGPPGEQHHFVQYNYVLNVALTDYSLKLYLNDHNIINNPTTDGDNTLLIASGPRLTSSVFIPSPEYQMQQSDIKFDVSFVDLDLSMSLPDWNTHAAFLTERTRSFASAPQLTIDGSYRFFADAHPDHVEQLALNVKSEHIIFKALGWLIRHTFNFKDNYFGAFTHFVTLEEYRHRHERNLQGDPLELKHVPGAADNFEVVLSFQTVDGLLLLPQEIFDCETAIALAIPALQVDLRNHDFFMEMSLNMEPLVIAELVDCSKLDTDTFTSVYESVKALHVQGIDIGAHRLFGPQPRTATYMCIWTLGLGNILGSVPISFAESFARAGAAFSHNFDDVDNALPPEFAVLLDPDATFVNIDIEAIDIALDGVDSAVQLEAASGISVKFDDLASARFLKHVNVEMPSLVVRALLPVVDHKGPWIEVAHLETDLSVVLGSTSSKHDERKKKQRDFIAEQDATTRRCAFVYGRADLKPVERIGTCYMPALEPPFRLQDVLAHDSPDAGPGASWKRASAAPDKALPRMPSLKTRDNRFGSYASVLSLFDRTLPEHVLDQPSFRKATHMPFERPARERSDKVPALSDRLDAFDLLDDEADHETIALDVRTRRPVSLMLTPLVAQIVTGCAPANATFRAEQSLDRTYSAYLSSRVSPKNKPAQILMPRVIVPSIEVRSFQDVLRPVEKAQAAMVLESEELTMLSLVRLTVADVALDVSNTVGGTVDSPSALRRSLPSAARGGASVRSIRLVVGEKAQKHSVRSDDTRRANSLPSAKRSREPAALDLHFGNLQARLESGPDATLVSFENEPIKLDFVDEASELVIGSLWAWHGLRTATETYSNRVEQHRAADRQLAVAIAESVNTAGITSFPIFLSRVSYLVGASVNYRLDDRWKLLHQLRFCARSLNELCPVSNAGSDEDLEARFSGATARWPQWDIDTSTRAQDTLLATIFNRTPANASTMAELAISSVLPLEVSINIGTFVARLYHQNAYFNQLSIGPVDLEGQLYRSGPTSLVALARMTIRTLRGQIDRSLLQLVRHIANVRRTYEDKIVNFKAEGTKSTGRKSSSDEARDWYLGLPSTSLGLSVAIESVDLRALSGNLELGTTVSLAALTITGESDAVRRILAPFDTSQGMLSATVFVQESTIFANDIAVRERKVELLHLNTQQPVLGATLDCEAIRRTHDSRSNKKLPISVLLKSSIKDVDCRIPHDVTRVYTFFDEWRSEHMPVYDSLLHELKIDTVRASADARPAGQTSIPSTLKLPEVRVQAVCSLNALQLDITAGAALRLCVAVEPSSFTALAQTGVSQKHVLGPVDCALDVGKIEFGFSTDAGATDSFAFPPLHARLGLKAVPPEHASVFVMADPVLIILTTQIVDNVLAIAGRVSSDVDKIIALLKKHRATSTRVPQTPTRRKPKIARQITWNATLALRGFRVGAVGPASIQWLEAKLVEARISQVGQLHWHVSVRDLGLALTQTLPDRRQWTNVEGCARLAYFGLDVEANNDKSRVNSQLRSYSDGDESTPFVNIDLPRLHAVLQPVAIEALSDFVTYVEDEVALRRKTKADEIEAMQKHVKETIEIGGAKASEAAPTAPASIVSTCIFALSASSVAFVIPLFEDAIVGKSKPKHAPAFMVALPRLRVEAQKGSAASATIERFTAQFVSRFDQHDASSFNPESSPTMNNIMLPKAEARIRKADSGEYKIHVNASGLEVDVEASIAGYCIGLVDVYHLSKARFARYASKQLTKKASPIASQPSAAPLQSSKLKTIAIARFESDSGTIRVHAPKATEDGSKQAQSRPKAHRSGQSLSDFSFARRAAPKKAPAQIDIFRLPEVSAHACYDKSADEHTCSVLNVQINIHQSQNTLYPTLIPFVVEIARQIKETAVRSSAAEKDESVVESLGEADQGVSGLDFGNVEISAGLRVDRSRLEISCRPVATTARLNWDSGSLQLTVSPATRSISIAVSADGVEAGLRHALEYVDTLQAAAQGLVIAAHFTKDGATSATPGQGRFSLVANVPNVSSSFSMRHFEYWLCFKSVWLDRLPVSDASDAKAHEPTPVAQIATSRNDSVIVAISVNVGILTFSADLGSTFGRVRLEIFEPQGSFRIVPLESRAFSLGFGRFSVVADGAVNGTVKLASFCFCTRLRNSTLDTLTDLLHITIDIGKGSASIKAGSHDKLLLGELDPVSIEAEDDWRDARSDPSKLALHFAVVVPSVTVLLSTSTMPYIIWAVKGVQSLSLDQEEKADAHLVQVGLSHRPKKRAQRQQTISDMAARLPSLTADRAGRQVELTDKLDIAIGAARVYLFADSFEDPFFYRAELGKDSRASLTRTIDAEGTSRRQLHVGFGRLALYSQHHSRTLNKRTDDLALADYLSLFSGLGSTATMLVPAPVVDMRSIQRADSNVLEHWFKLHVAGQVKIDQNLSRLKHAYGTGAKFTARLKQLSQAGGTSRAAAPPLDSPDMELLSPLTAAATASASAAGGDGDESATIQTSSEGAEEPVQLKLPVTSAIAGKEETLIYKEHEVDIPDVVIDALGEATRLLPYVLGTGSTRAKIPGLVHMFVTIPLEELLIALSSTYQTQLARQKLAEGKEEA